jgi:hypothetical protein
LTDYCKKFDWYGPGKIPVEIGLRLQQIASQSKTLMETDYSQFDGTVGVVHQMLYKTIMKRLFPIEYHIEIDDLLNNESNLC